MVFEKKMENKKFHEVVQKNSFKKWVHEPGAALETVHVQVFIAAWNHRGMQSSDCQVSDPPNQGWLVTVSILLIGIWCNAENRDIRVRLSFGKTERKA